jgi:hypothetical protein
VINVPRSPIASRFAVCALLAACAGLGCGSSDSDRPSSTADTTSELVADEVDAAAPATASAPSSGEPGTAKRTCSPRATRECHLYYTDESGRPQCPASFQLCDVDGSGWLPCGEYQVGPSGDPERIDR